MSSTSVARQAQGRWMNSSVRPSSSPDAAADSRARTLVVPMAITRPPVARACSQAPGWWLGPCSARRACGGLRPWPPTWAGTCPCPPRVRRARPGPAARQRSSLRGEEAGGGCRHRPRALGEHRLVALGVGQRGVDVGRQRDDAVAVERRQLVLARGHRQGHRRVPSRLRPPPRRRGRGRPRAGAGANPPAGAHQRLPVARRAPLQQQDLDLAPLGLRSRSRAGRTRAVLTTSTSPRTHELGQVGHRGAPAARPPWAHPPGAGPRPGSAGRCAMARRAGGSRSRRGPWAGQTYRAAPRYTACGYRADGAERFMDESAATRRGSRPAW